MGGSFVFGFDVGSVSSSLFGSRSGAVTSTVCNGSKICCWRNDWRWIVSGWCEIIVCLRRNVIINR